MTSTLLAPADVGPATMPTRSTPRLRRMRYEPEPGAPPGPAHTSTRHVRAAPVPTEPVVGDPDGVRRALTGPLRLAMEVLDGRRPFTQLGRHFDAAALRYWRAAAHRRQVRAPARSCAYCSACPGPGPPRSAPSATSTAAYGRWPRASSGPTSRRSGGAPRCGSVEACPVPDQGRAAVGEPWHCLYLRPEPHGHGRLRDG